MRLLSSSRKAGQVPHALLFLWLLLLTAVIALMGYLVINNIRGDSDIEVQLELALERTRAAEELATSLEDKLMKAEVKLMKLQALEADSHNQCGEEIQRGKRLQRLLRHAEERLHAQGMLNSEVSLKASGNTAEIRAEDVGTAMDVRRLADTPDQVSIFYLSECFCTGIQVESVAMVTPLVHRLPNMKLNTCPEHGPRCLGYGDETKAALEQMTKRRKPKDPATEIFVSHIAYMGVCGHPAVPSTTRYTIARAMFEQDGITTIEATLCNKYDEVWVPAQFNVETFAASGVDRHRLHVVGEPVDLQLFNPDSTVPSPMLSETYGVTSTDYVFLSVFKWEERKNWKALAKAFAEEFEANPDVKLVIKTAPVHLDDHPVEEMQEYLQSLHLPRLRNGGRLMSGRGSRVVVHPESVEAKLLPQWYKRGDAFVLPTRGEGWGLPLAEAMAMRLPTIATDWGGQTEFMKPDNSFLVPTEKLVVSLQGFKWAQIDVKKLRSVMRFVYTHQKEASAVAARAHAHMHKLWSQEAVSATLEQRFRDIAKKVSTGRFDVRTSQTVAANAWEAV